VCLRRKCNGAKLDTEDADASAQHWEYQIKNQQIKNDSSGLVRSSFDICYLDFVISNASHWCGRGAFCAAVKLNCEVGWSAQK